MVKTLHIATQNVRGLNQGEKMLKLLENIYRRKLAIFIATESRLTKKGSELLQEKSTYKIITTETCNGEYNGVTVLLAAAIQVIGNPEIDPKGRYIFFMINWCGQTLTILAVYAPADSKQRKEWFQLIQESFSKRNVDILIGDFNCALNKLDRSGGLPNSTAFKDTQHLTMMLNEHNLTDAWDHDRDGIHFTYHSQRTTSPWKARIDRIYISHNMISHGCKVIKSSIDSDHQPTALRTTWRDPTRGPGYWKLNVSLLENSAAKTAILSTLERVQALSLSPVEKWIAFKATIQEMMKEIGNMVAEETSKKEYLLNKIVDSEDCTEEEKARALNELANLQKTRTEGARVRARLHGDFSDYPMQLLDSLEKSKQQKLDIHSVVTPKGQYNEPEEVRNAIADFYENDIYAKGEINEEALQDLIHDLPQISEKFKRICGQPIRLQELEEAIDSLATRKTPGADGIPAELYQSFKEEISPLLFEAIQQMMEQQHIPEEIAQGTIVLIPKDDSGSNDIRKKRPITLLNTDYKIISTIFTKRLAEVAPSIIHHDQRGFIPKRFIVENVLELQMILEECKKNGLKAILAALDFEKAFDKVDHDYICRVLQAYGFPQFFIQAVATLLKSTVSRILVNGHFSRSFPIRRGTKQGDPISGMLFAIALEPLARKIREDRDCAGFEMRGMEKKINLYADDSLLIARSVAAMEKMLNWVKCYENASTSKLNIDKTNFLFINNENVTKWKEGQNFTYLGFTVSKEIISAPYDRMIQSSIRFLSTINRFKLSVLAKASILKIFVLSRLTYYLHITRMSEEQIKQWNNLINWFLWKNETTFDMNKTYKARISIDRLAKSKLEGGLGIWRLEDRYDASLAAWITRLFARNPPALWSKVLEDEAKKIASREKEIHPLAISIEEVRRFPKRETIAKRIWYAWMKQGIGIKWKLEKGTWWLHVLPNSSMVQFRIQEANQHKIVGETTAGQRYVISTKIACYVPVSVWQGYENLYIAPDIAELQRRIAGVEDQTNTRKFEDTRVGFIYKRKIQKREAPMVQIESKLKECGLEPTRRWKVIQKQNTRSKIVASRWATLHNTHTKMARLLCPLCGEMLVSTHLLYTCRIYKKVKEGKNEKEILQTFYQGGNERTKMKTATSRADALAIASWTLFRCAVARTENLQLQVPRFCREVFAKEISRFKWDNREKIARAKIDVDEFDKYAEMINFEEQNN